MAAEPAPNQTLHARAPGGAQPAPGPPAPNPQLNNNQQWLSLCDCQMERGALLCVLTLCLLCCSIPTVAQKVCAGLNLTRYPPMNCLAPNTCCRLNQQDYACREDKGCNVCPECCHANFAPSNLCSHCVSQQCQYENLAEYGCSVGGQGCCPTAPLNASSTLKNCLIIGDSVTNGQSGVVAGHLKDICQTQKIIGNDAAGARRMSLKC